MTSAKSKGQVITYRTCIGGEQSIDSYLNKSSAGQSWIRKSLVSTQSTNFLVLSCFFPFLETRFWAENEKGAKTDQKLSPVGKNSEEKTFIVLKTKFAMKEKFDQAT